MSMMAPGGRETRVFVFKGWSQGEGGGIGKGRKGDEEVDPACVPGFKQENRKVQLGYSISLLFQECKTEPAAGVGMG